MNSISVIIPAYNRSGLLGATLQSLLAQTVPAQEIIVVDDGSTDGTAEVAESFGGSVRVIRQKNAGPGAARNRGFRESVGDFIHFFDSDDAAIPNKHEVQLYTLLKSGADIAYAPWISGQFIDDGFVAGSLVLQQKGLPKGELIKALLCNWSMVPHACLFRRSIIEKAGGFPEHIRVAEDQMMFLNCLLAGGKVVHSPGTLELYRTGDPSKITESADGKTVRIDDWARFLLEARNACNLNNIHPENWFGFRKRCFQAAIDSSEPDLVAALEIIWRLRTPKIFYDLSVLFDRWLGGVRARVTGFRTNSSYRHGELSPGQISGIHALSLHVR